MRRRAIDGVRDSERPGYHASAELASRRAAANIAGEPGLGVTAIDQVIAGVPCRVVSVSEPTCRVLYFHGGGYRMGTAAAWTTVAGRLARAADAAIVLVDYRLAPENPYPAALLDAATVYDAIGADSPPPLFVGGDSAGGGLAVGLVNAAMSAGARLPVGVILLSPWLDLRCGSATYSSRASTDEYFPPTQARAASDLYLQGHRANDPSVSPLLGVSAGFPQTLVFASSDEILLGDALGLTRSLADVGTSVSLEVVARMPHAWLSVAPDHPSSSLLVERVGGFVRQELERVDSN